MSQKKLVNIPASISQRLLTSAERTGTDFQDILRRYGMERFLFRLSESKYAEEFILKGAALFLVWTGEYYRPTRDMDFLSIGDMDPSRAKPWSKKSVRCLSPMTDWYSTRRLSKRSVLRKTKHTKASGSPWKRNLTAPGYLSR